MSAYEVDKTLTILEERALVPAPLVDVGVKGPVGDKSSELSRGDSTKDRTGGADVEPVSMIPSLSGAGILAQCPGRKVSADLSQKQ